MAVQLIDSADGPRVHIPLNLKRRSGRKRIFIPDEPEASAEQPEPGADYHDAMVIALARAFRWKKLLDEGKYGSIVEMAAVLGMNRWYMARLLRLTLLAPEIVEAIVDGREPDGMSIEQLRGPVAMVWEKQRKRLHSARS